MANPFNVLLTPTHFSPLLLTPGALYFLARLFDFTDWKMERNRLLQRIHKMYSGLPVCQSSVRFFQ